MAAALAALLALGVYAPTIDAPLVFDDLALIGAEGPVALGAGSIPYRPLRHASYRLDHWLGEGSPKAYHLTNVVLHALVVALVVALALELGATPLCAGVAAGLLAVHPLGVEVVAYVAGRRDLLVVATMLSSVLCWLRGWMWVALGLAFCSVASKESGLITPVLLGLASYGGFGPRRSGVWAALVSSAIAFLALAVGYAAQGPWLPSIGRETIAYLGRVTGHYAGGLLGATTRALDHPELAEFVASSASFGGWGWFLLGTLVAALGSWVFLHWSLGLDENRRLASPRLAGLFALANLAALLVYGGMHEPGADRHAYGFLATSMVGSAVWLASQEKLRGSLQLPLVALALVCGVSFTQTTLARSADWSSSIKLWRGAWLDSPRSDRAALNYAAALSGAGSQGRALRVLKRAVALRPQDAELEGARALLLCRQGRGHGARRALGRSWHLGGDIEDLQTYMKVCPVGELGDVEQGV